METDNVFAALYKALAAFQAELPTVGKNSTADMGSRAYKYANLTELSEIIYPLLSKHGLAFTALPTMTAGEFVLQYMLTHTGGAHLEGRYPLPNGKPQEIGSAITYARRYALCAITGVAPGGEDDDGKEAQKASPVKRLGKPVERVEPPAGFLPRISLADTSEALTALYNEAVQGGFESSIVSLLKARRSELAA